MALSDDEKVVLEEVVERNGDCLKQSRCDRCPFRTSCLSEFLLTPRRPPTKNERLQLALDALTRDIILNEDEIQRWLEK